MRLFLFITAISVVLPSIGCSSSLKCRRETALLRAEYLDLEDKYYALLANSGPTAAPSITQTTSPTAFVTDANPVRQPMIYGSGVQQTAGIDSALPEITYYDQSGGYPVQGYQDQGYPVQGYPVQGYPVESYPVEGETYYSDPPLGPTPSGVASPVISDFGTSLRSGQSTEPLQESYYPSPVEGTNTREPNSNQSTEDLPTPDSILDNDLDNDQSRFDFEVEDTHEIGNEIKIEMSSPITEIVINKSVSQGKNSDGRPGDDGIELLIQPQAADGSVVDEGGNLTISLIDPAADQGERQLGKWTFLKEEAILFFAEDEFDNRGILLDLKWDMIPINKRLTVYVRFETSDDRIMETTSDIFIDPPSELTMIQQQGDDDSEFIQMKRDEDQGWYKSQAARNSNGHKEEEAYSNNWGRSESTVGNSVDKRVSQRETVQPSSQPQWRPAR